MNDKDVTFSLPISQFGVFLAEYLGVPFVTEANYDLHPGPYDTVYLMGGSFGYCMFRQFIEDALWSCKKLVFVQIDYKYPPANQLKSIITSKPNMPVEWWSNCPEYQPVRGNGYFDINPTYINLNQIVWNPIAMRPQYYVDGILYYGSPRADRLSSINKYLRTDKYKVTISGVLRDLWKWYHTFKDVTNVNYITSFENLEELQRYQAVLYLEDDITKDQYESPSTKFYECVSAGIPILFDVKCIHTFKTAGLDISDWVVNSQDDIVKMLPDWDKIRKNQRAKLSGDYDKQFLKRLKEVVDEHRKRTEASRRSKRD